MNKKVRHFEHHARLKWQLEESEIKRAEKTNSKLVSMILKRTRFLGRRPDACFAFAFFKEVWVRERRVSMKQEAGWIAYLKNMVSASVIIPIKLIAKWWKWSWENTVKRLTRRWHPSHLNEKVYWWKKLLFQFWKSDASPTQLGKSHCRF